MTLEELYDAAGGDYYAARAYLRSERLISRVLLKFLDDTSCARTLAALEDRDLAAMFEAAHEAKGVCHNLYLTRLADVASQLTEELRPAEDHEPSEKRLAELADELARAHEATLDAIHAWAQAQ